jgi:methionyl-tRNA formyltransferase
VNAVLLVADEPNQWVLAQKVARVLDVTAVVLSRNAPRKRRRRSAHTVAAGGARRLLGWPLRAAWETMLRRYEECTRVFPGEAARVANVNDRETLDVLRRHKPGIVAVSGTNIVSREVLGEAQRHSRVLNLHTGISPYVKGGPNCTNWCLATGWFCLIGSTVMWLDGGIDSGPLLATERTPLNGTETLAELHWKVMEHAHDLYVRSLVAIRDGLPVPRVEQAEIAEGRTFYNADWTATEAVRAYVRFLVGFSPSAVDSRRCNQPSLRLVALPTAGTGPSLSIHAREG